MGFEALRELVLDLNFDFAHGVAATVTRPSQSPITTTVIPQRSLFDDQPVGREFSAREPRRIFAVRRDQFPELERGTVINAPERQGAIAQDWQVDGIELYGGDYFLARMIAKTSL